MSQGESHFSDLGRLAEHLRVLLGQKDIVLIYAFNATGKTRLSMEFKNIGKQGGGDGVDKGDTLYFNAYTEDLFTWNNNPEGGGEHKLKLQRDSSFFQGIKELEMENKIREFLSIHADFDFRIDTENWEVTFSRNINGNDIDAIKISRGEEILFIWCFYLAFARLAIDRDETYNWAKYLYIDDPVSSLDEQCAITLGHQLAKCVKDRGIKVVISTHYPLFYNVLANELKNTKIQKYFLEKEPNATGYVISKMDNTGRYQHLFTLTELEKAVREDRTFTYHFNMLRTVLEQTATFYGYQCFSTCLERAMGNEVDVSLYARALNIFSHGDYSLFQPVQMVDDNKKLLAKTLKDFLSFYHFQVDQNNVSG